MWHLDECKTSRVQVFRGEEGQGLALITLRDGDFAASHINDAERYRRLIWKEFFPKDLAPPTLIANLLHTELRTEDEPSVVEIEFGDEGRLRWTWEAPSETLATLNRLGAEWDEGSGYVPYAPPPPETAVVLRRIAVSELPESNLFRDMDDYLAVNWAQAAVIALHAGRLENIPRDIPHDLRKAALSLFDDPMSLSRPTDQPVSWMNGQHRGEVMRRQGALETIVEERRPIDGEPLPGELYKVGEF
ncbi:hypothetical protein BKG68_11030 [Mycobacteroides saopaulense]|uniref:Uncharacterized protein n=2 Tax=Mycobacteroides saopaulense TaxID=1578165 RepID=A0ABX3BYY8_9MYCO|nr:hypothetical protein BKG68_11030 [Mycobacteroides saopaulense]OHU08950.1 hypothetical protein BKG73_15720 [Mycobacteroides saopaulense]